MLIPKGTFVFRRYSIIGKKMTSIQYIIFLKTHSDAWKCKGMSQTPSASLHMMHKPKREKLLRTWKIAAQNYLKPYHVCQCAWTSCAIVMSSIHTTFVKKVSTYAFIVMTNKMWKIWFMKSTPRLYSLLAGIWFGYLGRTVFPVTSAVRLYYAVPRFFVGPVPAHVNSMND